MAGNNRYKVCLVWNNNHTKANGNYGDECTSSSRGGTGRSNRVVLDVPAAQTVAELYAVVAAARCGGCHHLDDHQAAAAVAVELKWDHPPQFVAPSDQLVRSVIPPSSKILVTMTRPVAAMPAKNNRTNERDVNVIARGDIVDLTSDGEGEVTTGQVDTTTDDPGFRPRRRPSTQKESDEPKNSKRTCRKNEKSSSIISAFPSQEYQLVASNQSNSASSLLLAVEDPTKCDNNDYWIYEHGPDHLQTPLGKWLVFCREEMVFATWTTVVTALRDGRLAAIAAKVATRRNVEAHQQRRRDRPRSNSGHGGGGSYVICVYTTPASQRPIGLQLCQLLGRDLHYKLDVDTEAGKYAVLGHTSIANLTVYYHRNSGGPSFTPPPKLWTVAESRRRANAAAAAAAAPQQQQQQLLTYRFQIVLVCTGMQHCGITNATTQLTLGELCTLVREPANAYDPHALQVQRRFVEDNDDDNNNDGQRQQQQQSQKIGYIVASRPSYQAHLLQPWLDQGLLQFGAASVRRIVGSSTVDVGVEGVAVPAAQDLLAAWSVVDDE